MRPSKTKYNPLVVITGPTASGKSAFAMQVAKEYGGEIICADSRTIYKGMDIGTAKPTPEDRAAVPHHLLDVVSPDQPFSAADFKRLALAAIQDISKRGRLPIMVGGTGLYIDTVVFDYKFGPAAIPERRRQLQELGVADLQNICIEEQIPLPLNSKNKRHLIRAIELGGLITDQKKLRPNTIIVGITTDRTHLQGRITKRADDMVKMGVLDEITQLTKKYGERPEAFTGNIYRTLLPVIKGELSPEEGLKQVISSDMQLAKRQMTWLKRNPYIIWGDPPQLALAIEHFVQQNLLDQSIAGKP